MPRRMHPAVVKLADVLSPADILRDAAEPRPDFSCSGREVAFVWQLVRKGILFRHEFRMLAGCACKGFIPSQ